MLFSVIIPTYNRLPLLREALASVRAQRCTDYELIVVDDGSSDGTAEALAQEGGLRVLSQPNGGPGAARNLGAQAARGDYLAFLDSDDLWFPWTLETYARVIAQYSAPGLIIGRNVYFDDDHSPDIAETACRTRAYPNLFDAMRSGTVWIPTDACAIRRDQFEAIGGFEGASAAEDVDLWLKAGCVPDYIHISAPVVSAQRLHKKSLTQNISKMVSGLSFLILRERSGCYPGGPALKAVREARIAMASRSTAIECLRRGRILWGVRCYGESFGMNMRRTRVRFLLGYPLLVLSALFRSLAARATGALR